MTSLLVDAADRLAAMTATDRSLLVEAGAGSGKTSIMAGRVAVLLASGIHPKHVAAITFTEFAASELRIRIERFVDALSRGDVPKDVASAFPGGVAPAQRDALAAATKAIDQLLCTTIHGFAQALVKPYPAEAGIDPGAAIMDPAEAEIAFDERYERWLRRRLTEAEEDDVVVALVAADENKGLELVRTVADFVRKNRTAAPVPGAWSSASVEEFRTAVRLFAEEFARIGFEETKTREALEAFRALSDRLDLECDGTDAPTSRRLVAALGLDRDEACFTKSGGVRQLRAQGAWQAAAAAAGFSKAVGTAASGNCVARYDACHAAFDTIMPLVAGEVLRRVHAATADLLRDWSAYKRAAALLDFDDLLYTARDLLARHETVRVALSKRFRHVLVDEFQDTDPLQIDILWRLCGEKSGEDPAPLARPLRQGALFLVGDPKQAIYRFRGADVGAYVSARDAMGEAARLEITANFRSVAPILDFVNTTFAPVLDRANGQPGFTALAATCGPGVSALPVAALDVAATSPKPSAVEKRDAEAEVVADLCARLVGNLQVRDKFGVRPCRYGDIALLAPVGTELWRFEEALEQRGIPVSTQAGKGFYRRQEVHDLIALARTLADGRDTLAFGALLRGPLVGLTEAELLDIADALPVDPERDYALPNLTLWTERDNVSHEVARDVLDKLQSLARRARTTTPFLLLADAVEMLNVRAQVEQRFRASADRALANVDLFLQMARAYDVRGMRAFARDMRRNWEEGERQVESRPDAEEHAVSLITVHAAKGLEWPVVVPINMTGAPRSEKGLMHDRRTDVFATPVLGAEPVGYGDIKAWNQAESDREHRRLWYVAATRARDVLVLPRHTTTQASAWASLANIDYAALTPIDPASLGEPAAAPDPTPENVQTRDVFAAQAAAIADATASLRWHRPSLHEATGDPTMLIEDARVFAAAEDIERPDGTVRILGGPTRGTIMHKLFEEVLTGEVADDPAALEERAHELLAQLGIEPAADPGAGIAPRELATTVVATLRLPEVAALRGRLVPEYPVFARREGAEVETLVAGIADAVAMSPAGGIDTVIDWKSDVSPSATTLAGYFAQLGDYGTATGAAQTLLVMATQGRAVSRPTTGIDASPG